ncbi:DegT/DnrJ/EryC1/StrS family aminotransferase [Patescibacteria group bacterium]|nr:DegT/DnrJ/EryC1/StrS family aminotransferase [Patescibacteria group bacterium]
MPIPLFRPAIGAAEASAIARVLRSKKLSRGKEVEQFEQDFAAYTKKRYAIAVNSGTSALHLLVRAIGWKKGDEVITTPFSFIASANALLFEGVTPVFVDIDPETLNIDVKKIEEKITPKTKGILLVHILGLPVQKQAIQALIKKHHLTVIEDACEAVGRPSSTFPVAQIGAGSAYGFHENKPLTSAGEGGMIVTDDPLLAKQCRALRDQGRATGPRWLEEVILGFNFRLTELQAAFGAVQLKRMDTLLAQRRRIAERYTKQLANVPGISLPANKGPYERSWFIYYIICTTPALRTAIQEALQASEITTSTNYFPPIHRFPMYRRWNKKKTFPITEQTSQTLLALPCFPELSLKEVDQVASVIKKTINQYES